jgi:hypothetical protein
MRHHPSSNCEKKTSSASIGKCELYLTSLCSIPLDVPHFPTNLWNKEGPVHLAYCSQKPNEWQEAVAGCARKDNGSREAWQASRCECNKQHGFQQYSEIYSSSSTRYMRFVYGGGWQNVDAALRAAGQRKSSRQV